MIERPLTDAEWRAQDDARTLAVAEEIKADKDRLSKAAAAAGQMVAKEKEGLKALAKVAGKSSSVPRQAGPTRVRSAAKGAYNVFQQIK